ncbi:MAG: alpha/beta fold hydrolase [bacterium]
MTQTWRLFAIGLALIVAGSFLAHSIQTAGGVTVRDVRFPADSGYVMSALLYTPPSATPAHRAPAVLVSHGYINTREMQSAFAIELSRRGFVVLAMDMTGHGYSQGTVGAQGYGGPAALRYLRSLPVVDTLNVGMEGHSMGGGPILAAAAKAPNDYVAMVLEGSTTGTFGRSGAGTPTFPHNVAVVFGQYDEFAPLMWQAKKGSEIGQTKKLLTLFGATNAVTPNTVYGSTDSGTARILFLPAVTHPMEHFSNAGVGHAVDWLQRTLKGAAAPRDPLDQIWLWKEVGTLTAFVGFVALLLGVFQVLLTMRWFAPLNVAAAPVLERRDGNWWLAFALTTLVPALTFYSFMKAGTILTPNRLFPEGVMNQLVVWALLNGVITLVVGAMLARRSPNARSAARGAWGKSLLIALVTVGVGYLSLVLMDALFTVDFRFWVVGLKPLDARHLRIALAYLLPWTAFFVVSLRALNRDLSVKDETASTQYITAALALCLGFAVVLSCQYASLYFTGVLLTPKEALNTIVAIQFVPLLAIIGVISAFTYRRTGTHAPGALICAMFVTWYIAAGTAIHA